MENSIRTNDWLTDQTKAKVTVRVRVRVRVRVKFCQTVQACWFQAQAKLAKFTTKIGLHAPPMA